MYYYAQINEESLCIGVSCLSGKIEADNMIEIPSYDTDYIYRKYENGQWSEEKYIPEMPDPLPDPIQEMQSIIDAMLGVRRDE